MATREEIYANKIFLNAALPLLKVIVDERPKLAKGFNGKSAIIQISARDPNSINANGINTNGIKVGTHFVVENGQWTVKCGTVEKADLELEFKSIPDLNNFFSGKSKKLPKIKGISKLGLFISTLKVLLTMASMLGAKEPPNNNEDKELLVKLYFYLLSSGISQLNKASHPEVTKWAKSSPDRVYSWVVNGKPELSAYIRVKAGNTKAGRGLYTYSKPFFTMRFDSVDSALGTLLEKDDIIDATIKEKLIMEGAPEFGAMLGEFMKLVGSYAK